MIEAGREIKHRPDGKARVQVLRSRPFEQQMGVLLNRSAMQVRRAAVRRALRRTHPPTLSPPSALSRPSGHSTRSDQLVRTDHD
jgi:hypothetical protein